MNGGWRTGQKAMLLGIVAIGVNGVSPNSTCAEPTQETAATVAQQTTTPGRSGSQNVVTESLRIKGKAAKGDNVPLFIKSDTVTLDSKERVFTYRGNVEVTRDDLIITSDIMTGRYDQQNRMQLAGTQRDDQAVDTLTRLRQEERRKAAADVVGNEDEGVRAESRLQLFRRVKGSAKSAPVAADAASDNGGGHHARHTG